MTVMGRLFRDAGWVGTPLCHGGRRPPCSVLAPAYKRRRAQREREAFAQHVAARVGTPRPAAACGAVARTVCALACVRHGTDGVPVPHQGAPLDLGNMATQAGAGRASINTTSKAG